VACDVPGAKILRRSRALSMYAISAQLQGLAYTGVPLAA
jgi:histidinol-phosphate aminotransferase